MRDAADGEAVVEALSARLATRLAGEGFRATA
jgi:hypothetical protein